MSVPPVVALQAVVNQKDGEKSPSFLLDINIPTNEGSKRVFMHRTPNN